MANRRSRELMFALLLICSVIALPSVAADAKRSSGVKQTSDAPCGWRLRNSGLPTAVSDVVDDPAHPDFIYAATYLGVFRSTNAGNEWTRADHLESAHTVAIDPENPSVVSPGALGTYFRSDVTLMSSDAAPQEVVAFWLAAGTDGTDAPALRLTLGPSAVTVTDFIGRMGFSGLGSLLLIAIDSGMNVDADANLTGFSRIWTAGPEGGGSVSQSLPAVGLTSLASNNAAAAIGLRMDPEYRTNVGVVNLDLKPHAFVVTVRGQRKSATFTIAVEPLSMRHVSLPAGDYGEFTAHFEMTGAEFPWAAYGASVDNATGDGWASLAVRPQNAQR